MELNPNHPTTSAMREQWHKILAFVIRKYDLGEVVLTAEDIEAASRSAGGVNVVVFEQPDGLHIKLVDDAEAHRLARKEGGLPT